MGEVIAACEHRLGEGDEQLASTRSPVAILEARNPAVQTGDNVKRPRQFTGEQEAGETRLPVIVSADVKARPRCGNLHVKSAPCGEMVWCCSPILTDRQGTFHRFLTPLTRSTQLSRSYSPIEV